jgi:hypothetical protein
MIHGTIIVGWQVKPVAVSNRRLLRHVRPELPISF